MNKLKKTIFNSTKSSYYRIFADFGCVIPTILTSERCWCSLYTFFSTLGPFFNYFYPSNKYGCFPTKDMQTSLPRFRSGYIDKKIAQCAEAKDVLKKSYHIISRFRVMGVQKWRFGHLKISFSS